MNIEPKQLVELVGISGLIASLVFVGLQLRQSQEIAIAGQYQSRAELVHSSYLVSLESTGVSLRLRELHRLDRELSDEESRAMNILTQEFFLLYDNNHFQYEIGFLDIGTWEGLRVGMRNVLRNQPAREYFQARREGFRPSYVEWVESILSEAQY